METLLEQPKLEQLNHSEPVNNKSNSNMDKLRQDLGDLGINKIEQLHYNLTPAELVEKTIVSGEGHLSDRGALMIDTGKFTGRAPKDRFIVKDDITEDTVWWGAINQEFEADNFDKIYELLIKHFNGKEIYVRDAFVGADPAYQMNVRVVDTFSWHNLFVYNMFLKPTLAQLRKFAPDFTVLAAPDFELENPEEFGLPHSNFAIVNFTKRMIIIGGTAYAGEIKKGMFAVMNYFLPEQHNVLAMHCSANKGAEKDDVAIFFGLSGTGKTTLSADPNRLLIGDDEHGWTDNSVFNFEGGCYAKVVDLTEEKEPEIWNAIKFGAILENTRFYPDRREVDYTNTEVTENTRVSYPLNHIANAVEPSMGGVPQNIFFLTCDAYGVLPPISKLTPGQAMYHFISGYTAKVAGTEAGVTEPTSVFSACFGAPFMPLHPTKYAELLGEKMERNAVNVWLINTGWSGGSHGVGSRVKLKFTRAMITAALEGKLNGVDYERHPVFKVAVPQTCPEVPNHILNPRNTWDDKDGYDATAKKLAKEFRANFKKFEEFANPQIMAGAPEA